MHAHLSTDEGASWQRFATPTAGGAAYSALVELPCATPEVQPARLAEDRSKAGWLPAAARVGLLFESNEQPPGGKGRPVTVLRYGTLTVPLREPLPTGKEEL